jgi:hypothetical protein
MAKKKMLILRACGMSAEKHECDSIKTQAEMYELEVHDFCPKTNQELIQILNNGITYNYIYLSSHGNDEGFGNEAGTVNYSWYDFGIELCYSGCLEPECIVMLSCCRGGLNQVAFDLFYCCLKIDYVVGPRQSLTPHDMLISFNIFLYSLELRRLDPVVACKKIESATDIRFVCFDRLETVTEPAYIETMKAHNTKRVERSHAEMEQVIASLNTPPEVLALRNS